MKKLMMMAGVMGMFATAFASTETSFGYQGVLRDDQGAIVSGLSKVMIDFNLYQGAEDTKSMWGHTISVTLDTNGLFNAELSDANGTPLVQSKLENVIREAEEAGKSVYVGLTVKGSSGEIRPRQKLISVPVASYAQDVSAAKGDFEVSGQAVFNNGLSLKSGTLMAPAIDIETNATISGEADITGNTAIGGKLTVAGNAHVDGNCSVTGALNVAKRVTAEEFYVGNYCAMTPVGAIMMWSGSATALPPGWYLCEGTTMYMDPYANNHERTVPDLRGRFVVGINSDREGHSPKSGLSCREINSTGGCERVVLKAEELAAHTHNYLTDDSMRDVVNGLLTGANLTDYTGGGSGMVVHPTETDESKKYLKWDFKDDARGNWDKNETGQRATVAYTGKNNLGSKNTPNETTAHENMPPYFALCYIIYLGDSVINSTVK